MYKEINDKCVQRLKDGAFVARNPNSISYKAYLKWKAEQPPEEPTLALPEINTKETP